MVLIDNEKLVSQVQGFIDLWTPIDTFKWCGTEPPCSYLPRYTVLLAILAAAAIKINLSSLCQAASCIRKKRVQRQSRLLNLPVIEICLIDNVDFGQFQFR